MPRANEYHHIAAWGRLMRSPPSYIAEQQALAAFDNAPLDAIYRCVAGWVPCASIKAVGIRTTVEQEVRS